MKRLILSFFALLFIGSGVFLIVTFFNIRTVGQGALRVSSNVKAEVFLDGVRLGTTPVCKCERETIKEGEYLLNIVPNDKSLSQFSVKIKLTKGILTAVDRTFLPGTLSSAYILTLEKIHTNEPQLFVSSIPEGAIITLNSNPQGITPYLISSLKNDEDNNEHEIELQKIGFNKKTLRVRAIPGYKLIANIILGTELREIDTPSPSTQPAPLSQTASASAAVTIQSTPTGFLRVRSEPSLAGPEVGRVEPGEKFIILDEQTGWYKIELADKTEGWVSSQYAEKSLTER